MLRRIGLGMSCEMENAVRCLLAAELLMLSVFWEVSSLLHRL